jgi:hypothetical protein
VNPEVISSNATLSSNGLVFVDTSISDLIITLPEASSMPGRFYMIKKKSPLNALLLKSSSGLDGGKVFQVGANSESVYPSLRVVSDGLQWYIENGQGNFLAPLTSSSNLMLTSSDQFVELDASQTGSLSLFLPEVTTSMGNTYKIFNVSNNHPVYIHGSGNKISGNHLLELSPLGMAYLSTDGLSWSVESGQENISLLNSANLVSYYPFEETLYDVSVINHGNPTLYGGDPEKVWAEQMAAPGVMGNGIEFTKPGSGSSYVSFDNSDIDAPSQWSVSFWIQPKEDMTALRYVLDSPAPDDGSTYSSIYLTKDDSDSNNIVKVGLRNGVDGDSKFFSSTDLNVDQWSHVVMSSDGTKVSSYLNGQLDAQDAASEFQNVSAPFRRNGGNLILGASADLSKEVHFMLDELYFFNEALSESQIHHLSLKQTP